MLIMKHKVVIIGHGYTSRLAVIRSLAKIDCEITVVAIVSSKGKKRNFVKPIDSYSKYISHYFYFDGGTKEELIEYILSECIDKNQKVVIFPDSDFSAAAVDIYQERLKDHFIFPNIHNTPNAIVDWMNKTKQKKLAREIGLHVANSTIIEITDNSYNIPANVIYPCFVKPLITINGGKQIMQRCLDEVELTKVLDHAAVRGIYKMLVEDFIDIDTEYAVIGFSNGNEVVIPGIIQIIDLAHAGHFGVACRGKIFPVNGFEELITKFIKFVLATGFVGIFDIDFFQSNGEFYFGELNLRIGGSCYAVTQMGVNLPGMMVKYLYGEDISTMPKAIEGKAIYVNERMLMDDWFCHYITTRDYYKIMKSADISFVKDKNDPLPFKFYQKEFCQRRIKRIIPKAVRIFLLRLSRKFL